MSKLVDMTGQKIGKLTVLKQNPIKDCRGAIWICQCECGNIKSVSGGDLRSKRGIRSCGCSKMEPHTKHNMCHTKEYEIWKGILRRCYNKNSKSYKNYGGRGIKVCDSWKNSFENFYRDMGSCPTNTYMSIDRIDNDDDYKPSNCKWSTRIEQNRNRSYNHIKNVDQANKIRDLYSTGNYTQKQLSVMYNCSENVIHAIVNYKTWY